MEPFFAVWLPWKKRSRVLLAWSYQTKQEFSTGLSVFWCLIIIITILLVAGLRQTGIEAEENRAHPQREDRLFFNQWHGKQEKVTGQQPVGSNPSGPRPTENCGRQKTRRRKRWDVGLIYNSFLGLIWTKSVFLFLSLCFATSWSPINFNVLMSHTLYYI